MQTSEPLAAQTPEAAWLFNELGGHTWMWYQRHGMSLHRANDDYWNWLVPGIGRAPVGSFLILIAAFVVVIGPVNYFLLRRKRRLYLLLVTVPLGAALVTAALFAYALISDGLGIRVRVRSFTEIDQRAGRAVSWSRQSYYAGLAPSGGLTFPETAVVFPIEHYPVERQQAHWRRSGLSGATGRIWLPVISARARPPSSWSWSPGPVRAACSSNRRRAPPPCGRPIGWKPRLTVWSSRTRKDASWVRRSWLRDNAAAWTRSIRRRRARTGASRQRQCARVPAGL